MKKRLRKKVTQEWEWFAVKVLYECKISGNPTPEKINYEIDDLNTFEETILLIKAPTVEQAYLIGEKEALKNETEYLNQFGETVEWKFIEILDCFELFDKKLQTGTELYSRFIRVPKDLSKEELIFQYYPEVVKEKN
ncbi:DUF4288 domain-containing protein [Bacillus sp. AFS017336]|uniref:DUF4288 domain-containing protein n=1 Tax=Bacillus sp. AFS017336 TaxID=2033489 RepID=UPI000BF1C191|nr:DUF4288 domain-containing protein [Bacillus sp. AFS017336]PEL07600.1 S-ribosylhomocysteinase [Bacillus sp. AFS017336]